jgi:ABC-type Fe3+ transport system permease subunit
VANRNYQGIITEFRVFRTRNLSEMPNTTPLVLHSLGLTLETLAVSVPIGTALAWFLVRTDLPGRRAALWLIGLMIFLPLYLQAPGRPASGKKAGTLMAVRVARG